MRVFNVFLQGEKVLCELDIYSVVGANKPLQLLDARVSVGEDGAIALSFEGVHGSPVVSGICIRRAPKLPDPIIEPEYLTCNNCATEIEVPLAQSKLMRSKSTEKYEKKIQDLTNQCQLKSNECYEAWMSLTAASEQLEKVRMELDDKMFQTHTLDQTIEKQAARLRDVSSMYDRDKKFWNAAVNNGLVQFGASLVSIAKSHKVQYHYLGKRLYLDRLASTHRSRLKVSMHSDYQKKVNYILL